MRRVLPLAVLVSATAVLAAGGLAASKTRTLKVAYVVPENTEVEQPVARQSTEE